MPGSDAASHASSIAVSTARRLARPVSASVYASASIWANSSALWIAPTSWSAIARRKASSSWVTRGRPGAVMTSSSPQGSPWKTIGTHRLDSLPSRLSRSRCAGSLSGSSIAASELPPSRMASPIDG